MRTHYDGLEGYEPERQVKIVTVETDQVWRIVGIEEEEPDTATQMMGGVISFAIIIGLALAGFLMIEWALGRLPQ